MSMQLLSFQKRQRVDFVISTCRLARFDVFLDLILLEVEIFFSEAFLEIFVLPCSYSEYFRNFASQLPDKTEALECK